MKYLTFLSLVLSSLALSHAHSWIDEMKVTGGAGPIDGSMGYIRGFVGHNDFASSYRMETPGQSIYKDNQREPNQPNALYQRLKASPGAEITAQWLENGHTTNNTPENEAPGYDSGKIYMYGTTSQPNPDLTLEQIWKWTPEGPLEARFLGEMPFDDGKCAEEGSQGKPLGAPRWAAGGGGPCKGKFNLPEDLQPGQTYTVYWVWNFSGKVPGGTHFEWYSSIMDIDIVANQGQFPPDNTPPTTPLPVEDGTNNNQEESTLVPLRLVQRSAKFRAAW